MVTAAIKLRRLFLGKVMTNLDSLLKSRGITLPTKKGPSSQSYGFPCNHVRMWEVGYNESWAPKNWCFWIVVLEKTLESPLDCKEIQPVHPKENPSWIFFGRTDAEVKTPILWPLDAKNWLRKRPRRFRLKAGEKQTTKNETVGWYHQLDGKMFGCIN